MTIQVRNDDLGKAELLPVINNGDRKVSIHEDLYDPRVHFLTYPAFLFCISCFNAIYRFDIHRQVGQFSF